MTKITPKRTIANLLKKALDWYRSQRELPSPDSVAPHKEVKLQTSALRKTNDYRKIIYKSAIALKLAHLWQLAPMEVAEKLAKYSRNKGVINLSGNTPDEWAARIEVTVVPPGLLLFELTDGGIAAWLQYFCEGVPLSVGGGDLQFLVPDALFKIQYSHARCCSLLRMAASGDRLSPLPDTNTFALETPKFFSWEETDGGLRLKHPAERGLIWQLFSIWDLLYFPTATPEEINWQKAATALSEAFQFFYSQCRIFGEVKIENPELAKARFGLIFITKYLLRRLLEEKLKIKAPREL
ncbi:MAG: DALR anticodon-binding domain-containing protein [Cyanobacteriota bacterium]|nr:DALR anticodon-binding domain-containing protein [Cyanobacteriota bacterium]